MRDYSTLNEEPHNYLKHTIGKTGLAKHVMWYTSQDLKSKTMTETVWQALAFVLFPFLIVFIGVT